MTPTAHQLLLAQTALSRTEDELLTELGIALAGGPELTRDGDLDDFRARARYWLARNMTTIKQRICGNPALDSLIDEATEVAAIADLLTGIADGPQGFTVAALLLKRGLTTLCL